MADKDKQAVGITITGEQFIEALKELRPPDQDRSGLSKERRAQVYAPQGIVRWRLIPMKSPVTDATMFAKVIESRKYPNGRIVELHDYRHPMSIYKTVSNGGTTPDGFDIFAQNGLVWTDLDREPPKGALTPVFRQHRYDTYFLRDLRLLIGTGMNPGYCADPKAMETPWRTGQEAA